MVWDILIVGGGPVGLLAALEARKRGFSTLLVEKLPQPPDSSRAIGITPPSLDIFRKLEMAEDLVAEGTPIRRVQVQGTSGLLGSVDFSEIPGEWPFILSLPQVKLEARLREQALSRGAEIRPSHAWIGLETAPDAEVLVSRVSGPGGEITLRSRILLACDGARGTVREVLDMDFRGPDYPYSFVMGDFPDHTGWGTEARLWFTPRGAVESFPLPGGLRRWIVQTGSFTAEPEPELISRTVRSRTGLDIGTAAAPWQSPFRVRRRTLRHYLRGKVLFLGDSAHLMSPIGGQGMNTGFADVRDLFPLLEKLKAGGWQDGDRGFRRWDRARRRAFRVAADRAWRGMFLGIQTGYLRSALRNAFLFLMLRGPWKARIPLDYSMRTIPEDRRLKA